MLGLVLWFHSPESLEGEGLGPPCWGYEGGGVKGEARGERAEGEGWGEGRLKRADPGTSGMPDER